MRQKKTFPCGHRGFGRFCHACTQQAQHAQRQAEARAGQRQARATWEATFADDPIDLRGLPRPDLVAEARRAIVAMAEGQDYRALGGKQLVKLTDYVSIPLGHRHRIIFKRAAGGRFVPYGVYSHEAYNGVVARLNKTG